MSAYREEMAWAGGFFEGEGCFTNSISHGRTYAEAQLKNTDLESVERFQRATGLGYINGPYLGTKSKKPFYVWTVRGHEKTQALLAILWPWLGQRRGGRGLEVLRMHRAARERG